MPDARIFPPLPMAAGVIYKVKERKKKQKEEKKEGTQTHMEAK